MTADKHLADLLFYALHDARDLASFDINRELPRVTASIIQDGQAWQARWEARPP